MNNEFYLIFFLTILLTRVFLYYRRINSPIIRGFRCHHYMYGMIIVVFSLVVHSLVLYAIGVGLFVDELAFLFLKPKNYKTYYSKRSMIGTFAFVFIVFLLRNYLVTAFVQF